MKTLHLKLNTLRSPIIIVLIQLICILFLLGCMSSSRLTSSYIGLGRAVCIENDNMDIFAPSEKKITVNGPTQYSIRMGQKGTVINTGFTINHEYGYTFKDPYLDVEFENKIILRFEWDSLNFQDAYFLKEAIIDGLTYPYSTTGGFWYLKECN